MKERRRLTKGNKWVRSEFNRLWKKLVEWTVVHDLEGWSETPDGMMPPANKGAIAPFTPVVVGTTSKTITIYPGWFNAPKSADTDHEIPDYYLYPWMPEINAVALDHASPNVLALTDEATNFVYLEVTLTTRSAIMGATDASPGDNAGDGMSVYVWLGSGGYTVTSGESATHTHDDPDTGVTGPNNSGHTHTISDVTHDHEAQLNANQLAYHIASAPQFKVIATGSDFPKNTSPTVIKIPWGKFVMGEDGVVTSMEWYWTGHRDWNPDTWVQSSVASGHEGDDDQAQNPKIT